MYLADTTVLSKDKYPEAFEQMEKVVKEMLPFYAFMVIALLLITFIPAISLGIPWALGYGK
jgi:hypothetical protein